MSLINTLQMDSEFDAFFHHSNNKFVEYDKFATTIWALKINANFVWHLVFVNCWRKYYVRYKERTIVFISLLLLELPIPWLLLVPLNVRIDFICCKNIWQLYVSTIQIKNAFERGN